MTTLTASEIKRLIQTHSDAVIHLKLTGEERDRRMAMIDELLDLLNDLKEKAK